MPTEKCLNCRFVAYPTDEMLGECRRYAPRPFTVEVNAHVIALAVHWPRVHDDDWCGDFVYDKETEP